ncbi:MAG: hypothetical protein FWD23_08600 [Oscillospiraceae bacterium]|nr:hypothetical protein [Oscillospiraceae bacterium]
MDREIKITPTGKMPVSPDGGGQRPNGGKQRLFGPAAATALLMMGVAVILIRFVYAANVKGKTETPQIAEKTETAPPSLTEGDIRGSWSMADYVENFEDFDPAEPNYKRLDLKLPYCRAEFFDDGTLVMTSSGLAFSERGFDGVYRWMNKESDIFFLPMGGVSVCAVRNIGGKDYMFADFTDPKLMPGAPRGYCVLVKNKTKCVDPGEDITGKDTRNYDFAPVQKSFYTVSFDENTLFPREIQRTAQKVMESGKNPGLGLRALHERGITGKGVNVAIIDEPLEAGHPEYRGKIAEYRDFGSGAESSAQGPAIAGLLAGETVGAAPGVNIYYAAVPAWEMYDAAYYASALDWIIEVNGALPEGEKIRVVCISPNPENPLPWINVEQYLYSFMRAEKEGMIVLDCTNEHGAVFGACGYDYKNFEDVSLCKPKSAYRIAIAPYHYDNQARDIYIGDEDEPNENMLRVPVNYRTLPASSEKGEYRYRYDGKGRLSWALPYAAGVLAMGWQLKPGLGGEEMIKILFETAYTDKKGNRYIHPGAFIEYLDNY